MSSHETSTVRRGLGRGLGALIPSGPSDSSGSAASAWVPSEPTPDLRLPAQSHAVETTPDGPRFAEVPLDAITPNPRQPREVFDEDALAELVHSIREVGLLQPIVVRQTRRDAYELVMGERRWRAAQAAGLERIPAIVRATDDADMLRDALLENLHRAQLNPLEEAAAYQQMIEDFGCTHEDLAQSIGRSRPRITNTLRLLRLSPPVQRRVAAGVLSAGHARALVTVEDPALQESLAARVVAEGISVRALEEIVATSRAEQARAKAPRAPRRADPELLALGERLGDRLETRVKVDMGRDKGRVVIEFATAEDLARITALIAGTDGSDAS
ncbi:ParB/RepB/Spo0J family partition protein [Nocardioidaceae bacterium]|nr:ParB/RepB/Spo0J family partition protein [Nocardioidaceae bacterium]